jgi:hypothetical protein
MTIVDHPSFCDLDIEEECRHFLPLVVAGADHGACGWRVLSER